MTRDIIAEINKVFSPVQAKLILMIIDLLIELKETLEKNNNEQNRHYSVVEAANYLGITKQTLYKYNSQNLLSYHKANGKKIYYLKDDLDSFICSKQKRITSTEESDSCNATRRLLAELL